MLSEKEVRTIEEFLEKKEQRMTFEEMKAIVKMNYEIYKTLVPKK